MYKLSNAVLFPLLFFVACRAITLTGSFTLAQTLYEYQYTVTTSSLLINFQLTLTPFFSSALLIGSSLPFNPSTNRENWIHYDYSKNNNFDYQGMVTGSTQSAWIKNMPIGSTIYFKLLNFDPTATFSYVITITEANTADQSCPSNLIKKPGSEYCQFCDLTHIGNYCDIKIHAISSSVQTSIILPAKSYTYLLLKSSQQIKVTITFDLGIKIYIQQQVLQDQLPGITNYLYNSQGNGKLQYLTGQSISFDIQSSSNLPIIGLINPQLTSVNFSILFQEKSGTPIIIIIVAVFGGIIFLALVVVGIVLIRRMRNSQRVVIPQQPMFLKRPKKLSKVDLQYYFPVVSFSLINPQLSLDRQQKQSQQFECVICLCGIGIDDLARVGYCKHIFHAYCLSEWFKKQQNCPYCRCNYERSSTVELHKKLQKKAGKKLQGQQIIKYLFLRGQQVSLNTINITQLDGIQQL